MKKIFIGIIIFVLSFFNIWLVLSQWFGVQKNTSIWVAWIDDVEYNKNESFIDFAQAATNWILALAGLIATGNFIIHPNFSSFKKILYVWMISFVVNIGFSFYRNNRRY